MSITSGVSKRTGKVVTYGIGFEYSGWLYQLHGDYVAIGTHDRGLMCIGRYV